MTIARLSFEIAFPSLDSFIDHWSSRYRDEAGRDGKLYDPHIGTGDLRAGKDALMALFEWKNGGKISNGKTDSITRNYFDSWIDDAELERRYLNSKNGGGPVWNIFYLHCRQPSIYPIFDQHAYRAMVHLKGEAPRRNLTDESSEFIYDSYRTQYRPFVGEIVAATGRKLRDIDRAMYTFGQFLKLTEPYACTAG